MRLLGALLVLGVAAPAAADCPDVQLDVKLKKAASGLSIDVVLKNAGKSPIALMTTGDGSSFGKRNPSLTFTLLPNTVSAVGTCGFINALADEDFLTLQPGARHPLSWVHPPTPGPPGHYTLTVTYKNDPAAEPVGSGAPTPPTAAQRAGGKNCAVHGHKRPLHFTWDGKRAAK